MGLNSRAKYNAQNTDAAGNHHFGFATPRVSGQALLVVTNDTTGTDWKFKVLENGVSLRADLLFEDATFDIGKSGATRPRDGFFSRNVTVGGSLAVTSTVTANALVVTANGALITGNSSITGTLGISGLLSLASGISVSGNATVGGTLGVTGAVTLSSTLTAGASTLSSLSVTSNAAIGGTLTSTGAATFSSTISTAGTATLASAAITGNATVAGTLGVTGTATFSSNLAAGSLTANRILGGSGNLLSIINSAGTTVVSTVDAGTTTIFALGVTSNTTIGGTLGVTGFTSLASATITGELGIAGSGVSPGEGAAQIHKSASSPFINLDYYSRGQTGAWYGRHRWFASYNTDSPVELMAAYVSAVTVSVPFIASSTGTFNSNVTVAGTLGVSGNATLVHSTHTGNATINGTLTVQSTSTLASLAVQAHTTMGGNLTVDINAAVGGTLGVTGAATFGSTVGISGALTAASLNLGTATMTDVIVHSEAFDIGNIAGNGDFFLDITVNGAAVGDYVFCDNPWMQDDTQLIATACVIGANTVRVAICNVSSSVVDPDTRTVRITVIKAS